MYKTAKEKLNWEPKVNLQDGLSRTIKFFSEKLRSEGLAFSLKNEIKNNLLYWSRLCGWTNYGSFS